MPEIQRKGINTYLNIYKTPDDITRNSCIECNDRLTFDIETCIMTYQYMSSIMKYQFNSHTDIETVKKLFD